MIKKIFEKQLIKLKNNKKSKKILKLNYNTDRAIFKKSPEILTEMDEIKVLGSEIVLEFGKNFHSNYIQIYGINLGFLKQSLRRYGLTDTSSLNILSKENLNNFHKNIEDIMGKLNIDIDFIDEKEKKGLLHHQNINNLKARQHRLGYPSRGGRRRSNAQTARLIKPYLYRWMAEEKHASLSEFNNVKKTKK